MTITIGQITLAANRVEAMQVFYNVVFGAKFSSFTAQGETLYRGTLAGVPLIIAPAQMLGVEARKNRFQFDFNVPDIEKWVSVALAFGGKFEGSEGIVDEEDQRFAVLLDPDGNTLVLVEKRTAGSTEPLNAGVVDDPPEAPPPPEPDPVDDNTPSADFIYK
ncbi:MAG: hypothetical protein GYB64_20595 [Chloroflexi bacterium]|nr:hypothetical protein [Chloroflexota bacterium]